MDLSLADTKIDSGREAWMQLFQLLQAGKRQFQELAGQAGLAPIQVHLLLSLDADRPGPMSDLAELLCCDASYVTNLVDRLEAKGFLERQASTSDRRVKLIAMTDAGRQAKSELMRRVSEPPPFIANMSDEDRDHLRDILARAAKTA
jgi:DNA-binding MarR family transcriptional regulator